MNKNHLQLVEDQQVRPVQYQSYVPRVEVTPEQAREHVRKLDEIKRHVLRNKVDYDIIPGTPKPTLLKPGAERLLQFFGLGHKVKCVERVLDWEKGFFYFCYRVNIVKTYPTHEIVVAECEGSANSREKKYRNQDPYSIVNTLKKMAIKRALVGATLQATGTSEFFTQDVEDMELNQPTPQPTRQPQPRNDKPASQNQIKAICAIASSKGLSDEERDEIVKALTGKESKTDLTSAEASKVIEYLQGGGQ